MSRDLDHLATALTGRYALERELGRGGMATVYLAQDLRHQRPVALKVLHPELATALGPERFLREITLTAGLQHPHILPLLDSGEAAGVLYYTMPFVEGESLRDRLDRERQLPLEDALQITREVADALSYAHSRGIIHRDIKPENILLAGGHARVADFGIARAIAAAGSAKLTETGLAVGTPAYMSPEQAAGSHDVDGRSDVYSLGCVLYEMLSGETPYLGNTPQAILAKKLSEPLPRISVVRETVPAAVEAALAKALARVPADRFTTAAAFVEALTRSTTGEAPAVRRRPRWGWMAGLAVVVVLAAALGIVFATRKTMAPKSADPLASNPNLVAVLPFRLVSADTGSTLRTLALGLPELFAMKITGEFGPRVAHPPTVLKLWTDAGGALAAPLDEAGELDVARTIGAGRLVRGTVVATDTSLVLTGEVVAVPSGSVRVVPTSVEGRREHWLSLVDRLAWELLAQDVGIKATALPQLTRYKPRAIQAWLAGMRTDDLLRANELYRSALAEDSTMVVAALSIYAAGEARRDSGYARIAWEHRDRLTPSERAYLLPLAGWRFGATRNMSERIDQYRALTRAQPEANRAWSELGSNLATSGAVLEITGWREEARQALEIATRIDPEDRFPWWNLLRLAFIEEDTALVRQRLERVTATALTGLLPRLVPAYRWRLAMMRTDTMEAARLLASAPDSTWIPQFVAIDGRGLAIADRIVETMGDRWGREEGGWYPRMRGRYKQWQREFNQWSRTASPIGAAAWRVRGALFLDGPADSTVAASADLLERVAAGRTSPAPTSAGRAHARCWSALWLSAHGDTTGAARTVRQLEREVEGPYSYATCVALITVHLEQARGGDVRAAVHRLDSIVRQGPWPFGTMADLLPPMEEVPNLMLARLLAEHGDTMGALAASRRRIFLEPFAGLYESTPEFLREEGRLAAMTDDTAGAIRAYSHYLALRADPDYAPWRAVRDSVRRELAALKGERRH